MIGLGKSIAHTGASMGYGWNQEKDAKVVYREHLSGENPKEITQEFKVVQSQNHKCKKNTLSFVLSPTVEDGKELNEKELKETTERFVKEMKLQERQAIAFVHRNKKHLHIHLYVNRIGFDGKAYKDNFIGKRSQQAAERVAWQMGLTTVREVQQQKLEKVKEVRAEIRQIHEKVISEMRPKDFDHYIKYMKEKDVQVIPSINKSNRLQGFRFGYKGHELKGSDVHRSMSMARIAERIGFGKQVSQNITKDQTMKLLGNTVQVSPNLAAKIAAKVVKQVIKRTIDKGIGVGIEI
ncbi:relaxase/mobilization nuclease domain-containing protein [Ulvibacterium marinum]|uniref:Mobilization protein n=1 Tax=Ulvibacterium marinum TaxID=2419782 RepID=A0A3B0C3Y8_9FLAO|nr:relaxase/mobilization nuclease domain-containing protein [Ulvibacterium marinum]RKN77986.1 mobilization protein [Ulvibacterium marinum]